MGKLCPNNKHNKVLVIIQVVSKTEIRVQTEVVIIQEIGICCQDLLAI